MLILLKDKKFAVNLQCISELYIFFDKKDHSYKLKCTISCSSNGTNSRTLDNFKKEEDAVKQMELIVNQYEKGHKIFKL